MPDEPLTYKSFVDWLSEQYPRDCSDMTIANVLKKLPEKIMEDRLDELQNMILEDYEYKTFPSVPYIVKKCNTISELHNEWQDNAADKVIEYCRNVKIAQIAWAKDSVGDLVKHGLKIRKAIAKGAVPMIDREFIHYWDALIGEYLMCKDKKMEPADTQRHLEYIKECIVKGKEYKSIRETEMMPETERYKHIVPVSEALKNFK